MHFTDTFLNQKRHRADPVADEFLRLIVQERGAGEARRLFDRLIRNIELPIDAFPEVVRDFLSATDGLPEWADHGRVQVAQDLFLDHGPKFLIFLYYKSLPLLYSCANGAQVLVRTSRLTNEEEDLRIFSRRIAETGQFLIDVMGRGNLQAGGKGIRAIQKVRLIHASIRHFIPQDQWDEQSLGKPINQEDMAVTLMTFSISLIDALEQFHIREEEERLEAYLHTWTAIGHVLGVDDDLLPADLEEARALINKILERQSRPSRAGQLLAKALLQFARETIPIDALDDGPVFLMRHLIGPQKADMLRIRSQSGCLGMTMPLFMQKFFSLGEKLEDKLDEPMHIVLDKVSEATVRKMVQYIDRYKERKFDIPEEMEEKWFQ